MNSIIGVIVPVYKTEKYIAECIESILAQTYTKFRLILVDDGSPDGAGAICDEYAKKDKRITVIHQENAGVTRARARGVEEASDCEWITFVDSDDTIIGDTLERLYSEIDSETDIILIDYFKLLPNIYYLSIDKYLGYLLSEERISSAPWGKLFRKEILTEVVFTVPREIIVAEDMIMNIRIALNTKKHVKIIHQDLYIYKNREDSTFHSHIRTPENEQAIHENKIKTIPKEYKEMAIRKTLTARLLRFREFWGYKYSVEDMKKSKFYISLHSDIKKYKFNMPFIDWIIFNNSNFIIRFLAINTKKITNKIYR